MGGGIELPKRHISSTCEFEKAFPGVKDLVIEATERSVEMLKSKKLNKKDFLKKESSYNKNTIICDVNKKILVSQAKDGKIHDLTEVKKHRRNRSYTKK